MALCFHTQLLASIASEELTKIRAISALNLHLRPFPHFLTYRFCGLSSDKWEWQYLSVGRLHYSAQGNYEPILSSTQCVLLRTGSVILCIWGLVHPLNRNIFFILSEK